MVGAGGDRGVQKTLSFRSEERAQSGRRKAGNHLTQNHSSCQGPQREGGTGQLLIWMRTCGLYFTPKIQRPHSFQISVGHATLTLQVPFLIWPWDLRLMTKWPAQILCSPPLFSQLTPKSEAVYILLGGPSLYFNFLFCIRVQVINNSVTVSGEQWRGWAIHIHVSILYQTTCPSRLPHDTEQNSMCRSRSLLVIHLEHSGVYTSIPNPLTALLPDNRKLVF